MRPTYVSCVTPIMTSVSVMALQIGSKVYTCGLLLIHGPGGVPLKILTSAASRLKEALEARLVAKLTYFERDSAE